MLIREKITVCSVNHTKYLSSAWAKRGAFFLMLRHMVRFIKIKGKFHPRTGHEGTEVEDRYSCTLSLTPALGRGYAVNAAPRPLYSL
jgi:hypothetical protein